MCLARVEFVGRAEQGQTQDSIPDVVRIDRTERGWRLTDLVGVATDVEGEVRSIDFMESRVSIERPANRSASE